METEEAKNKWEQTYKDISGKHKEAVRIVSWATIACQ
jgi:hypothetical protein